MQSDFLKDTGAETRWLVIHPLSQKDSVAVAALRAVVAPMKGKLEGTAARGPLDDIMERVSTPEGVTFEAAIIGGITGWWGKPAPEHPFPGAARPCMNGVVAYRLNAANRSRGTSVTRSGAPSEDPRVVF